ncbi:hypothetical protein [Streptomyces sp. NBC_01285]|uniref:hypothetical protein n=1 Tax=Streptomyces sp. NBC_01285 TaxID=2903813 RepID=UPI00225B974F|nr:hypothetical protein [Streptomyces sp. NBC_01285]MCX4774186.1 hypothetical protein [Streptomyces sp. NBC_01285]
MRTSAERQKVRFAAGGTECAAWHHPGTNGGCVIMAGGGGVTKEPATSRNATRHQSPLAMLRLTGTVLRDAAGALLGRRPVLAPLAGELSFLRRQLPDTASAKRPAAEDASSVRRP